MVRRDPSRYAVEAKPYQPEGLVDEMGEWDWSQKRKKKGE
jgi:hypothetical protein